MPVRTRAGKGRAKLAAREQHGLDRSDHRFGAGRRSALYDSGRNTSTFAAVSDASRGQNPSPKAQSTTSDAPLSGEAADAERYQGSDGATSSRAHARNLISFGALASWDMFRR